MNPDFKATFCESEDEEDYWVVWLADDKHEPANYLTFQRAHEFDEQDLRLGLNAVYVERNDQGYSGYGGMRSVSLFADRLHMDFDDEGARSMGGMVAMTVAFDFAGAQFESLRSGLHRIFREFDYFHDHTHGPLP